MPAVPVNDNSPLTLATGIDGQTAVTFQFWIKEVDDLQLYVDEVLLEYGVDYTATPAQADAGGTITLTTALDGGELIAAKRKTDVARISGYTPSGSFEADVLNLDFASIIAILQELVLDAGRTVRLTPYSAYAGDLLLPEPSAGKAVVWNADEDGLKNSTSSVDDAAASASASAAAALVSQNAAADSQAAAATSAAAALVSQNAAAVSAAAALVSENASAASEAAAAISETNSAASEAASAISETNSAASEAAAAISETNSAASEAAAAISETNSAASEAAAAISKTAAETAETNAETAETNAETAQAAAEAALASLNFRTVVNSAGHYTITATDRNKLIQYSGTGGHEIGLTAAATLGSGFEFHVTNTGTGNVTLNPSGVETIDSELTIDLEPGQAIMVVCDGFEFFVTLSKGYDSSVTFPLPTKHISGPAPLYTSGATITLLAGLRVRDSTDAVDIVLGSNVVPSLAVSGAGGLDTGAEASNTWYYVYLVMKADGTISAVFSVTNESVTGSITLPADYVYKRQLPIVVKNNASSNIIPFWVKTGWPNLPVIRNNTDFNLASEAASDTEVLAAGTNTTLANGNIACGAFIPPCSRLATFHVSAAAALTLTIREDGSLLGQDKILLSAANSTAKVESRVSSTQTLDYAVSTSSVDIAVYEYVITELGAT